MSIRLTIPRIDGVSKLIMSIAGHLGAGHSNDSGDAGPGLLARLYLRRAYRELGLSLGAKNILSCLDEG
jgi:hypothetical protein